MAEDATEKDEKEKLIEFITKNDFSHHLDSAVHDVKSKEASRVNNEGAEAQVTFLLENGTDLKEIMELVGFEEDLHSNKEEKK